MKISQHTYACIEKAGLVVASARCSSQFHQQLNRKRRGYQPPSRRGDHTVYVSSQKKRTGSNFNQSAFSTRASCLRLQAAAEGMTRSELSAQKSFPQVKQFNYIHSIVYKISELLLFLLQKVLHLAILYIYMYKIFNTEEIIQQALSFSTLREELHL